MKKEESFKEGEEKFHPVNLISQSAYKIENYALEKDVLNKQSVLKVKAINGAGKTYKINATQKEIQWYFALVDAGNYPFDFNLVKYTASGYCLINNQGQDKIQECIARFLIKEEVEKYKKIKLMKQNSEELTVNSARFLKSYKIQNFFVNEQGKKRSLEYYEHGPNYPEYKKPATKEQFDWYNSYLKAMETYPFEFKLIKKIDNEYCLLKEENNNEGSQAITRYLTEEEVATYKKMIKTNDYCKRLFEQYKIVDIQKSKTADYFCGITQVGGTLKLKPEEVSYYQNFIAPNKNLKSSKLSTPDLNKDKEKFQPKQFQEQKNRTKTQSFEKNEQNNKTTEQVFEYVEFLEKNKGTQVVLHPHPHKTMYWIATIGSNGQVITYNRELSQKQTSHYLKTLKIDPKLNKDSLQTSKIQENKNVDPSTKNVSSSSIHKEQSQQNKKLEEQVFQLKKHNIILKQFEQKHHTAVVEIEKVQKQLDSKDKLLRETQTENNNLKNQIKALKSSIEEASKEQILQKQKKENILASENKKIIDQQNEIDRLNKVILKLQTQSKQFTDCNLQKQNAEKMKSENEGLISTQIKRLQKLNDDQNNQMKRLEDENESLILASQDQLKQIQKLKKQIQQNNSKVALSVQQAKIDEIEKLKRKIEILQEQNTKLSQKYSQLNEPVYENSKTMKGSENNQFNKVDQSTNISPQFSNDYLQDQESKEKSEKELKQTENQSNEKRIQNINHQKQNIELKGQLSKLQEEHQRVKQQLALKVIEIQELKSKCQETSVLLMIKQQENQQRGDQLKRNNNEKQLVEVKTPTYTPKSSMQGFEITQNPNFIQNHVALENKMSEILGKLDQQKQKYQTLREDQRKQYDALNYEKGKNQTLLLLKVQEYEALKTQLIEIKAAAARNKIEFEDKEKIQSQQIKKLKEQIRSFDNERQNLKKEKIVKQNEKNLSEKEDLLKQKQAQIIQLNKLISVTEKYEGQINRINNKNSQEIKQLSIKLNQTQIQLKYNQQQLKKQKVQLNKFRGQVREKDQVIKDIQEENKNKIIQKDTVNTELQNKFSNLSQKCYSLEKTIQKLSTAKKDQELTMANRIIEQTQNCTAQINKLKEEHQKKVQDLNNFHQNTLAETTNANKKQIDKLNHQIKNISEQISSFKTISTQSHNLMKSDQQKYFSWSKQFKQKMVKVASELQSTKSAYEQLKSKYQNLEKSLKLKQIKNSELENSKAELMRKAQDKDEVVIKLQAKIKKYTESCISDVDSVKSLEEIISRHKNTISKEVQQRIETNNKKNQSQNAFKSLAWETQMKQFKAKSEKQFTAEKIKLEEALAKKQLYKSKAMILETIKKMLKLPKVEDKQIVDHLASFVQNSQVEIATLKSNTVYLKDLYDGIQAALDEIAKIMSLPDFGVNIKAGKVVFLEKDKPANLKIQKIITIAFKNSSEKLKEMQRLNELLKKSEIQMKELIIKNNQLQVKLGQINELSKKLQLSEIENQKIRSQLERTKFTIIDLNSEVSKYLKEKKQLLADKEVRDREVVNLNQKIAIKDGELNQAFLRNKKQKQTLQEKIRNLNSQIALIKKENDSQIELFSKNKSSEQQFSKKQKKYTDQIAKRQSEKERFEKQFQSLQNKNKQLQQKVQESKGEAAKTAKISEEKIKRIEDNKIAELLAKEDTLNKQLSLLKRKEQELRDEGVKMINSALKSVMGIKVSTKNFREISQFIGQNCQKKSAKGQEQTMLSVSTILEGQTQERLFLLDKIKAIMEKPVQAVKFLWKFDEFNKNIANYLPVAKKSFSFVILFKTKGDKKFGAFCQGLATPDFPKPRIFVFSLNNKECFYRVAKAGEVEGAKYLQNFLNFGNMEIRLKNGSNEITVSSRVFGSRYYDFNREGLVGTETDPLIAEEIEIHRIDFDA